MYMKSSRSTVLARQACILEMLTLTGTASTAELAASLKVSQVTIRRDIADLIKNDIVAAGVHCIIERSYGGVTMRPRNEEENIFSSALTANKAAIARYAASLVEDGDTIFINTSSTAVGILPFITAKQVTVITNNVKAMSQERRDDMILVFTGGELRFPKEAMVGDFALQNLNRVTASKCFLGCNGINLDDGMMTAVLQEATINSIMFTRVAGPRYILADQSKIGRRLNFTYGKLDEVTTLITDTEADPFMVSAFQKHIQVVQVKPEP
jgi:DeoR/GlpR family transcriptional regulator of sugar metabolism